MVGLFTFLKILMVLITVLKVLSSLIRSRARKRVEILPPKKKEKKEKRNLVSNQDWKLCFTPPLFYRRAILNLGNYQKTKWYSLGLWELKREQKFFFLFHVASREVFSSYCLWSNARRLIVSRERSRIEWLLTYFDTVLIRYY